VNHANRKKATAGNGMILGAAIGRFTWMRNFFNVLVKIGFRRGTL
jgi:hypothetical protein